MLDTRIPLMARGISGIDVYNEGAKLADTWLERQTNAELANIKRQTQDITDPSKRFMEMIGIAKQSKRSPWLIDALNAEKAAGEQAQAAAAKQAADLQKTEAETGKINAEAGKTTNETLNKRHQDQGQIWAALAHGGAEHARVLLQNKYKAGLVDDDEYATYNAQLDTIGGYEPAMQRDFAMAMYKSMQDPKYTLQTEDNRQSNITSEKNNALNNQTSLINNQTNAEVAIFGHKVDRENYFFQHQDRVADNAHEARKFQAEQGEISQAYRYQENALRSGQAKLFTANDGRVYVDYGNDQYLPLMDKNGQTTSAGQNKPSLAEKNSKEIAELQGHNDLLQAGIDAISKARELSRQGIYGGWKSNEIAKIVGYWKGGSEESRRTQEYNNIIQKQALQSMKAVFGANPTDGERKAMLEVEAISDYPPKVREAILDNAERLLKAKMESNRRQMSILGRTSLDDILNQ